MNKLYFSPDMQIFDNQWSIKLNNGILYFYIDDYEKWENLDKLLDSDVFILEYEGTSLPHIKYPDEGTWEDD